ncbi:MAG: carboxypeptidase-like regulatory domain-containing protein [Planctomycetota bacterium]
MNASVRHFLRLSRKAHVLAATIVFSMAASIAMAQPAGIKLNDQLTVPQWVLPEVPGELSGRLVLPSMNGVIELIANADLVMVNGLGESVQARTNGNGEFRFIGIRPGVYALSAAANNIAACCAMHVLPPDMAAADNA